MVRRMKIPEFYKQTTPYTCGAASLLMVLNNLNENIKLTRENEITIWKDATFRVIECTSNIGLAYAALKRGFKAKVLQEYHLPKVFSRQHDLYVNNEMKKIYLEQLKNAKKLGLEIEYGDFDLDRMLEFTKKSIYPIVLISSGTILHFVILCGYEHKPAYNLTPEINEVILLDPTVGLRRSDKDWFAEDFDIYEGKTCICVQK